MMTPDNAPAVFGAAAALRSVALRQCVCPGVHVAVLDDGERKLIRCEVCHQRVDPRRLNAKLAGYRPPPPVVNRGIPGPLMAQWMPGPKLRRVLDMAPRR